MPNPNRAHQLYADAMEVVGLGYPLWYPEPDNSGQVLVGDVGFVEEGRFCRLFNVLHPKDDPVNCRGVPDGFEVLDVNDADFRYTQENFLQAGPISAKSVQSRTAAPSISVYVHRPCVRFNADLLSRPSASVEVSYNFTSDGKKGASVVLQGPAQEDRYTRNAAFRTYMRKHHQSWCDYAFTSKGYEGAKTTDLVLVSGCVSTASEWALTAFREAKKSHQFSLSVPTGSPVNAKFEFAMKNSQELPTFQRSGPQSRQEPRRSDQCLFIRCYKLKLGPFSRIAVGETLNNKTIPEDPDDVTCCGCFPRLCGSRKRSSPSSNSPSASSKAARVRGGASGLFSWGPAARLRGGSDLSQKFDRRPSPPRRVSRCIFSVDVIYSLRPRQSSTAGSRKVRWLSYVLGTP